MSTEIQQAEIEKAARWVAKIIEEHSGQDKGDKAVCHLLGLDREALTATAKLEAVSTVKSLILPRDAKSVDIPYIGGLLAMEFHLGLLVGLKLRTEEPS